MKDINATIITDLSQPEDKIFNDLHKDARWGIKKAIKSGLIVEESTNWDKFYEIYKQTVIDGGSIAYPLDVVKSQSAVLFVCKYNNEIIGGITIGFREDKYDKNIPSLSKLASKKEFQILQPNDLLVWECIKWAKKNGYKQFDLGGWQINARGHLKGINKFKEKFGKLTYYYKDYPIHIAVGRKLIRNSKFFWWLNNKRKNKKVGITDNSGYAYFSKPDILNAYIKMDSLFESEKLILEQFVSSGLNILDVGCGQGRVTCPLDKKGCNVIGIDIVSDMIKFAKNTYPNIDFRVMDCCNLKFEDAFFDVVFVSYNTLDYIFPEEKRLLALKEIKRVLKKGGLLIYSAHNSFFKGYKVEQRKNGKLLTYRANPFIHIYNIKKLGFKLSKTFGILHSWCYYIFEKSIL